MSRTILAGVIALGLTRPGSARAQAPGRAPAELPADYQIVQAPPPTLLLGLPGVLSLSIVPSAGRRLHASAPVVLKLKGDGARPERALLVREDAVDPRADAPRFELKLVPERAGEVRLLVRAIFYVCDARRCRPVETTITWPLTVLPRPGS